MKEWAKYNKIKAPMLKMVRKLELKKMYVQKMNARERQEAIITEMAKVKEDENGRPYIQKANPRKG